MNEKNPMLLTPEQLQLYITAGLDCDCIEVRGDGRHFEALIVSPAFRGLSRIAQHQNVYTVLGDRMQTEIHALSLKTFSPEEWAKQARSG